MMGCMWCLHHEVCLVVFLPPCTGWFRRFLVANACLLGRVEHAGHPFDCPRWFTVPEVLQWCDAPRTLPRLPG